MFFLLSFEVLFLYFSRNAEKGLVTVRGANAFFLLNPFLSLFTVSIFVLFFVSFTYASDFTPADTGVMGENVIELGARGGEFLN